MYFSVSSSSSSSAQSLEDSFPPLEDSFPPLEPENGQTCFHFNHSFKKALKEKEEAFILPLSIFETSHETPVSPLCSKKALQPMQGSPLSPDQNTKRMRNVVSRALPQSTPKKKNTRDAHGSPSPQKKKSITPATPCRRYEVPPSPRPGYTALHPRADTYNWCFLTGSSPDLSWSFNHATYKVVFLAAGEFHKVYSIEPGREMTFYINTPFNGSKMTLVSWKTEEVVLRRLSMKNTLKNAIEQERMRELLADNLIDEHCLKENIPLVTKVTSRVPGGKHLPSDYINQNGPKEDSIGWELCVRVNTSCIVPLCEEMRTHTSIESLQSIEIKPQSKEHLFQWLFTEWKAYVAYMVKTRKETERQKSQDFEQKNMPPSDTLKSFAVPMPLSKHKTHSLGEYSVLGMPRVGDFVARNIGYDERLESFVYLDLKMEDDAAHYLNETLKSFLGESSRLRREVVEELYKHASILGASEDFLAAFEYNIQA